MKPYCYIIFFSALIIYQNQWALESEDAQKSPLLQCIIGSLDGSIPSDSVDFVPCHSAFIELSQIGSKESVPLLIACLDHIPENPKKGIQCTWIHLYDALKAQTGEDFGFSKEDWINWWNEKGRNLPESYFNTEINKERIIEKYRSNLSERKLELIAKLQSQCSVLELDDELHDALHRIIKSLENVNIDRKISRDLLEYILTEDASDWKDDTRLQRFLKRGWFNNSHVFMLGISSKEEYVEALFDKSDDTLVALTFSPKPESNKTGILTPGAAPLP